MPWVARTVLTIALIALPLYLYTGARLASAIVQVTGLPRSRTRLLVLTALGWLYALPLLLLLQRATGTLSSSFLLSSSVTIPDYALHFPFWIGLIILLESVVLFLLLDLLTLCSRAIPALRERWRRWQAFGKVGIVGALILYVPGRTFLDTNNVRLNEIETAFPSLPRELEGFRIALVGDVQVDRYTTPDKLRRFRQLFERKDVDIATLAGDIVTSGTGFIGLAARALANPPGSLANVAVMGDHDHWADPVAIPTRLRSEGWVFLQNQHKILSRGNHSILLTGVTYVYSDHLSEAALRNFLAQAPVADFKIILAHQPAEELVRVARDAGYHLLLAGHTHGGQVVLHPLGIPFTPSRFETEYYSGAYRAGPLHIVVTNGMGLTLAPVRYHAPAELTLVTLRRVAAED